MPRSRYIAAGSNTTVVSGPGKVYGVIASASSNGGSILVADTAALGLTINFPQRFDTAFASNIAVIGPLPMTSASTFNLYGATFTEGLSIAATSNANLTVFYDG